MELKGFECCSFSPVHGQDRKIVEVLLGRSLRFYLEESSGLLVWDLNRLGNSLEELLKRLWL